MTDIVHLKHYSCKYRLFDAGGNAVLECFLSRAYGPKLAWIDYRPLSYSFTITWFHTETGVMHSIQNGDKDPEQAIKKTLLPLFDHKQHWGKTMAPKVMAMAIALNYVLDVDDLHTTISEFISERDKFGVAYTTVYME